MPRTVPSQPSLSPLSYDTFSNAIQASAPYSQTYESESKNSTEKETKPPKGKPPSRPTYSEMIDEAIFEKHQKRKGVSLIAIKKYLKEKYDIDVKKLANRNRICKYIRKSVGNDGHLKQMTGRGAAGSFMLTNIARKKYEIKKEKSIAIKSRIEDKENVANAKIVKKKPSKADRDQVDSPVTRMRVQ